MVQYLFHFIGWLLLVLAKTSLKETDGVFANSVFPELAKIERLVSLVFAELVLSLPVSGQKPVDQQRCHEARILHFVELALQQILPRILVNPHHLVFEEQVLSMVEVGDGHQVVLLVLLRWIPKRRLFVFLLFLKNGDAILVDLVMDYCLIEEV